MASVLDKTLWRTSPHDTMAAEIDALLLAANLTPRHVVFSLYDTVVDSVRDDLSDWMVRHPDWDAPFAAGKVQFVDEGEESTVIGVYTDPTWRDVLIEAERSCRARGAPELDAVFLEAVEPAGKVGDVARYELVFGS